MSEQVSGGELPLTGHLLELRQRLIRSVVVVTVIVLALMPFSRQIYSFLAIPLLAALPAGTGLIATGVAAPFLAPFKLVAVLGVFAAAPYLLFQLWSFVAPGLYRHEQRLAMPLLISSIVLFYCGAAFAYYVVFPLVFVFFTQAAPEGVAVMTDISAYLDFVLKLFFAFGLAFEVPIATLLLVISGIASREQLAGYRAHVIVVAFVLGMLLTPPDVISQVLLALPIWLLFEFGLLLSRMIGKRSPSATSG
ncbi:MAG: twin-arginine translocase subunit TatC [Gammaproteobacteria bacterium]|nr:MAG: twin-arginine translocase subunit TatC [Gammaproteobacteria bacterium]RLA11482.1 MAG: twin-arginine translocase subunit TatC [Gammaproteobacteria bacterium]RLA15871.1 MAG: twin-arginine translocase subunit TatC [Gammaproteobacteria bacterium]